MAVDPSAQAREQFISYRSGPVRKVVDRDAIVDHLDPIAGAPESFRPLHHTKSEVEDIAATLAAAHPDAPTATLLGAAATKPAVLATLQGASTIHVATHGYFAPESAWSRSLGQAEGALERFSIGRDDRISQLSPSSLTGLALAGANRPPNALGERPGILTAQELATLDLSTCYLATLSACDTALGVRSGGAGLASLRQALHAAGARYVLATLWRVHDATARELMADFYARMWRLGESPREALRAAQRSARQRGVPFGDWAGWVLTGR